jgi:hypothetical protein
MLDVFISHSTQDRNVANATLAVLEQRGVRCWMAPRDIEPGEDWGDAIIRGLDQCQAMILVFSQHANESRYVKREVERAIFKGMLIVPFRVEDVEPKGAMALFASSVHWLDGFPPPLHAHITRLADWLEMWLQKNRPSPPPAPLPVPHQTPGPAPTAPSFETVVGNPPLTPPKQESPPDHETAAKVRYRGQISPPVSPAPSMARARSRRSFAVAATLALAAGATFAGCAWWSQRPGECSVQTDPPGAHVAVNGKSFVAPARVPGLQPGSHKVAVELEGYEPRQLDFEVAPGQKVDFGTMKLERSSGTLLLSSDPDGAAYEVKSLSDEKAGALRGETPDSIKLPIGKYSVTMKHEAETKTQDIEVLRNVTSHQGFTFMRATPQAPVIVSTPPPAAPSAADTPPSPFPSNPPSSVAPPVSPVIGAVPIDTPGTPNLAAIIAAQPTVESPAAGYWKLSEILANSEYSGYSERGRSYVIYRAQQVLKLSADGVPGKSIYIALQKFQTERALQPTGQLDDPTLAAMDLRNLPDKSDWASEPEKTLFRKSFERSVLGGRDLKDIFRR